MTTTSQDKRTIIKVYDPSSSTPSVSHVNFPLLSVVAPPIRDEYIGISPSGEIYRFGPRITVSAPSTQTISTGTSKTNSIWQEMFGRDAFLDDLAPPPPKFILPPTLAKPTDVFDGPSHTLPPVSLLFDAFMAQLLKPTLTDVNGKDTRDTREKAGDTIVYEQEVVRPEKIQGQSNTNKVTDEDVKELEGFFKDLLSDSPAQITDSASMPRLMNGNTPSKSEQSTPQSKTKPKVNGTAVNGQAPTPRSEEGREKKNTKKRSAPKE